jgi:hypothetical protein
LIRAAKRGSIQRGARPRLNAARAAICTIDGSSGQIAI